MLKLSKFHSAVRLSFLLFVSILVLSCSKSEEVTPQSKLVGAWKFNSIYRLDGDGGNYVFSFCLMELTFNFTSKGVLTSDLPTQCQSSVKKRFVTYLPVGGTTSKYTATDTQLTVTDADGTNTVLDYTLNGTSLTIIETNTEDGVKTVTKLGLTKQ